MCLEPRSRKLMVPSSVDAIQAFPCKPDGCHVAPDGTVAPSDPCISYSLPFCTLSVYDMRGPPSVVWRNLLAWALRKQVPERLGHLADVALTHLGEERQRDRACAHVLAHRELAGTVAELLAIEAHQVDRWQVGLRVDPTRAQRLDGGVAIHAARQLHHV